MEKIDEDKTDYFVTRTSLTDVIATTEYFEAVEKIPHFLKLILTVGYINIFALFISMK